MRQMFHVQPSGIAQQFTVTRIEPDGQRVLLGKATWESLDTSAFTFDRTDDCTDEEADSVWMLVESVQDRVQDGDTHLDFTFEVDA